MADLSPFLEELNQRKPSAEVSKEMSGAKDYPSESVWKKSDSKSGGCIPPLVSTPPVDVTVSEENDEPTHTLFELLEPNVCALCGKEYFGISDFQYKKRIYFLCEDCRKMKTREIQKKIDSIENPS